MNYIFLSPNYPTNYKNFIKKLRQNGINVLAIGDISYDELDIRMISNITEYFKVDKINYENVFKAVAFFSFKYGKIDFLESINNFWYDIVKKVRRDFNIHSNEFDDFSISPYNSYDGLIDNNGDVIFEYSFKYDKNPILIQNAKIDEALKNEAVKEIKERGLKNTFFHAFKCDNKLRISENYDFGYIFDIINYRYDIDIYKIYANMIAKSPNRINNKKEYFIKVFEREDKGYRFSDNELKEMYRSNLCMIFEDDHTKFIFRTKEKSKMDQIEKSIYELKIK